MDLLVVDDIQRRYKLACSKSQYEADLLVKDLLMKKNLVSEVRRQCRVLAHLDSPCTAAPCTGRRLAEPRSGRAGSCT